MADTSIPREEPGGITPGNTQRLVIPREEIGDDVVMGSEVARSLVHKGFRKPHRRAFIRLKLDSEFPCRLLLHKPDPNSAETLYYFVATELRPPVETELKQVRVFLHYSLMHKDFALWPVSVTIGNSWYESLQEVLVKGDEFFDENEIKIVPDQSNSRYRVLARPVTREVAWPDLDMQSLLADAVGAANIITSSAHPLYQELTDGREL